MGTCLRYNYSDVKMSTIASQITGVSMVCATIFFRRRSTKTSKLRVTGHRWLPLREGQYMSNAGNVSIWWRHHDLRVEKGQKCKYIVMCSQINQARQESEISLFLYMIYKWWRHQMETFSAELAVCVGNSSVTGEVFLQRSVTPSPDVLFDLRLE